VRQNDKQAPPPHYALRRDAFFDRLVQILTNFADTPASKQYFNGDAHHARLNLTTKQNHHEDNFGVILSIVRSGQFVEFSRGQAAEISARNCVR
jgi:hypothetical protein